MNDHILPAPILTKNFNQPEKPEKIPQTNDIMELIVVLRERARGEERHSKRAISFGLEAVKNRSEKIIEINQKIKFLNNMIREIGPDGD